MVSLTKLKSKNIDKFKALCDKKFTSETYDKNFFEVYQNSNFIPKLFIKKMVKLIEYNEEVIGYIWSDIYPNKSIRILSMYIEEKYLENISESLLSDYDNLHLYYETIHLDSINYSLSKLGFYISKSSILMELNYNLYNNNLEILNIRKDIFSNYKLSKQFGNDINIGFKKFNKVTDIECRCMMQNSIFESDERMPISSIDIENDIKQDYFIEDLAIFITVNNQSVGYGQVILTENIYTIVNIGILYKFRGYGLSKLLLNKLIELSTEKNIDKLYLRVDNNNYTALSLYKWAGFEYKFNINTWER